MAKVNDTRKFDSLTRADVIAMCSQYRALRIRVPHSPPGHPAQDGHRSEGMHYGLNRVQARAYIWRHYQAVDWYRYLASK